MAKPHQETDEALIQNLLREVRSSRKYRHLNLPEETLRDLLEQALERQPGQKTALKTVREKLHNIVATYLGDPDYQQGATDLNTAYSTGQDQEIRSACLKLLESHASTRERIPLLDKFYARLWEITGKPNILLDLACGLHPLGLPWMQLPPQACYYAYDLHSPRIELIDHFFQLSGRPRLAFQQDILVHPPQIEADVAFFFKEAHRFEQRQRACNLPFWQALKVRWLLVSLPTTSLSGRHDLADKQRKLVYGILDEVNWPVTEILFENELVFCIQKHE